jgi:invasion protein IalB
MMNRGQNWQAGAPAPTSDTTIAARVVGHLLEPLLLEPLLLEPLLLEPLLLEPLLLGPLRAALVGCLVAAGIAAAGSAAQAQGAVKSVHGDWQIRCETPAGAQSEQCALFQSVVAEDRNNVGITVLVLKTADQKSRLMRVQAPLGVLLPAGLGLKIDNVDVGRAGFVRCLPRGCYAEVVMDDTLVGKLRTGQTATFFIFQTPEEGIGFPMGLKGFGDGYDKLP